MKATLLRSVHAVSHTTVRLTGAARLLPSFLIVGAQRCGTASLARALARHPLILPPASGLGVHYFDAAYHPSLSWYRAHFPLKATAVALARRYGRRPQAFECSPCYLFHPLAPARIAWNLPEVKLIVMVRDPVERAYSAYAHERALGYEPEPSFERALELEPERLAGEAERLCADPYYVSHAHRHHAYLARGRYAEQLSRLEMLFGRRRILVLDAGDYFREPEPVYRRVLEFLGLPVMAVPRFEVVGARPRPAMPESVRHRLREYFAPWDAMLVPWLGAEPSWRR